MISLNVESLENGKQRVTSRVDGRTAMWVDVDAANRETCVAVLRTAASSHEISNGNFDMTYIRMNAAASALMN